VDEELLVEEVVEVDSGVVRAHFRLIVEHTFLICLE
jgi:hypothetical protein